MSLGVGDLVELFEEFKEAESLELVDDVEERNSRKNWVREKFSEESIMDFGEGDIREIVRKLWAFQMWTNKDYIVDKIMEKDIEDIRTSFLNAFHKHGDLQEKYTALTNIPMMGTGVVSELLTYYHPNQAAIWNRKARNGLQMLNYSDKLSFPLTKTTLTDKEYKEFLKVMKDLKDTLKEKNQDINDFLELDYFLYYITEETNLQKEIDKKEKEGKKIKDFDHNEIRDTLQEIGDGLGFDVDIEYHAAPGARIDVKWSTKIANLGRIAYAFEVHKSGSRDSAILNLQKAKNADPTLQKLILVSNQQELEKLKKEIEAVGGELNKFTSYMKVQEVIQASENLHNLKQILQKSGLMEEIA
ncbi:hypothetical protein [Methanonatronarchaeum sp. AMET-Sl]|uniref:hypothetical protein n=1 Tax=Methanonatronarchaeum sp. AMET-Sl TaxID=3037654 RepID=UPI00244DF79C|nr:hypothetical protein [Methanonatronarchaeum sp. AMET-Sl]WGI17951.1 hypothetical protein QEN48_02805 [Methanonatronarchaeum sp. AMET-Sl]